VLSLRGSPSDNSGADRCRLVKCFDLFNSRSFCNDSLSRRDLSLGGDGGGVEH
jgi:hypothetical protein